MGAGALARALLGRANTRPPRQRSRAKTARRPSLQEGKAPTPYTTGTRRKWRWGRARKSHGRRLVAPCAPPPRTARGSGQPSSRRRPERSRACWPRAKQRGRATACGSCGNRARRPKPCASFQGARPRSGRTRPKGGARTRRSARSPAPRAARRTRIRAAPQAPRAPPALGQA
ncbi:predicted protein [Clavispora lusitaniae ATCC 42720]|uniref:Uncharacterized protein n=1 Tax=Clavispora lusitaniae (strain ATCC 42720) TaxID=306902 RepID=C4Y1F0_CLAL4|nr:uncharacterized protein CLUG_02032 [Clavispora lusitaniae ATCC 42720]EEQ37909.1 predicted protein [Clavispora lusitaniae ATCC 42720]